MDAFIRMADNWTNHIVLFYIHRFKYNSEIQVKDLNDEQQQKYYQFLTERKQQQEEFMDRFTHVGSNLSEDDEAIAEPVIPNEGEITEEDMLAWSYYYDDYVPDHDKDNARIPIIDEWKWQSSFGKITIKDMYYMSESDELLGIGHFIFEHKYRVAYINNGSKLESLVKEGDVHEEFNQQLLSFNYIRAKRVLYDPRNIDFVDV